MVGINLKFDILFKMKSKATLKELAKELLNEAITPLKPYGDEARRLVQLAQFITERDF